MSNLIPYAYGGGAEGLLPPHRQILERTGYIDYVYDHVEVIEYYPWPTIGSQFGPALEAAGDPVEMRSADLLLLLAGTDLSHTRRRRWYERVA